MTSIIIIWKKKYENTIIYLPMKTYFAGEKNVLILYQICVAIKSFCLYISWFLFFLIEGWCWMYILNVEIQTYKVCLKNRDGCKMHALILNLRNKELKKFESFEWIFYYHYLMNRIAYQMKWNDIIIRMIENFFQKFFFSKIIYWLLTVLN